MDSPRDLLIEIISNPEQMSSLALDEWDLLIRQARSAGLLAYLYDSAERLNLLDSVPEGPYAHLYSARILTNKHQRDIRWEVHCILRALEEHQHPVILLKGAAYLMVGLPISKARIFSDVDILVPKEEIGKTEETLRLKGWVSNTPDEYDQRYYRTWMHELPPMRHRVRNTTLDVHHNILPTTARLHPDAERLRNNASTVAGYDGLQVFAPEDMVLHSATHLFHDGELEHGIRDLVDLDSLLRHFSERNSGFWHTLTTRAETIGLQRPLYYALNYTNAILQTPVPSEVMQGIQSSAPGLLLSRLMDSLFTRALRPDHSSCNDPFTGIARWMLYVRSHYLRMPFHLLIPHLFHKAVIAPYNEWRESRTQKTAANFDEFMEQANTDKQR
ncbi:MAG: nucleotidyltransferase family protein [Sedimenticola sp.]